jgi:hypothetical protein
VLSSIRDCVFQEIGTLAAIRVGVTLEAMASAARGANTTYLRSAGPHNAVTWDFVLV